MRAQRINYFDPILFQLAENESFMLCQVFVIINLKTPKTSLKQTNYFECFYHIRYFWVITLTEVYSTPNLINVEHSISNSFPDLRYKITILTGDGYIWLQRSTLKMIGRIKANHEDNKVGGLAWHDDKKLILILTSPYNYIGENHQQTQTFV